MNFQSQSLSSRLELIIKFFRQLLEFFFNLCSIFMLQSIVNHNQASHPPLNSYFFSYFVIDNQQQTLLKRKEKKKLCHRTFYWFWQKSNKIKFKKEKKIKRRIRRELSLSFAIKKANSGKRSKERERGKIVVCRLPGEFTTNNFQYIDFHSGRGKIQRFDRRKCWKISSVLFNDSWNINCR